MARLTKTARDYLSELTGIAYDLQSQISNSNRLFELSSKILSAIEKLKEDYVIVPKSKVYKYTDYGAPKFDFITESWSIEANLQSPLQSIMSKKQRVSSPMNCL